jgi:DNA repair protein RadC
MSEEEIIDKAIAILESRLQKAETFFTRPADTKSYLKLTFSGLEHESFRALFLNSQNGLISCEELSRGTIDGASVYPREVVKAALQFNAAAVIFSHNHPSGHSEPSQADRNITKRLTEALSLVDIRVLDHIVVGGDQTYSFAEHGLI